MCNAVSMFNQGNLDFRYLVRLRSRDFHLRHETLLDQRQPHRILHTHRRAGVLHLGRKELVEFGSKQFHRDRGFRLESDSELAIDRERVGG